MALAHGHTGRKKSIPYVQELGVFPCREKYYTERERLPSF